MLIRILIIVFTILYQNTVYSKTTDSNEFNHRYLSNYFSAILSYDNQDNESAIKFFNSSKYLLDKHDKFLKHYVFSLVEDGKVLKAIRQIKNLKKKNNTDFFEAKLLIILDFIKKKNFKGADKILKELKNYQDIGTYEFIIYETIKSYNDLFFKKKIKKKEQNFGKLSLITNTLQNCYLNSSKTEALFSNIIDPEYGDYSRYLFFYTSHLIDNNKIAKVKQISSDIDPLDSGLLILQLKHWIDHSNYQKVNNYFSCNNETDLLGEFFYLISNLYSSEEVFKKSNFYLQISIFLNSKFDFNYSLIVENYFLNKNYNLSKKALEKIDNNNKIYNWYKIKKIGQIILEEKNQEQSLNYIKNNFKKIKSPSLKILYDMGNIHKKFKKYDKAIEYYSSVLSKVESGQDAYAEVLFRRGGSYERIGDYKKSDSDLLKSLEINPGEPYVLNYLAYSWLERKHNIEKAIDMLKEAYEQEEDDPYIIDSIGWGYYLIGDYINAEKLLKKAVQLMPDDPVVNDHYGDILWMLDRKLQAKYFWKSVLTLDKTEDKMKKDILNKLIYGLNKFNS